MLAKGAWDFWREMEGITKLIQMIETICSQARQLRKQRKSPRYHITGEIVITGQKEPIWGRLHNISLLGVLFDTDHYLILANEFPAGVICEGVRVEIERLAKDWEISNGRGKLVGARIESIAAGQREIWKGLLDGREIGS